MAYKGSPVQVRYGPLFMIPEMIKKGDLVLKKGIDKKFFNLLFNLYKPFLSKGHLKDRYQYSVFLKNKLIGIFQLESSLAKFLQIAFIPDFKDRGLARRVIYLVVEKLEVDKIGWAAYKSNYPSLKLLYNMGGGVFEGALKSTTKKVEGVVKFKIKNNKKINDNLSQILEDSKKSYFVWFKEYKKRKKEIEELKIYLKT